MEIQNTSKQRNTGKNILRTTAWAAAACILLAIIALVPDNVDAGGFRKGQNSAEEISCILANRLELSEEQQSAIQPILNEEKQKRHEIMERFREKRQAIRDAIQSEVEANDKATEQKLAGILTGDQLKQYSELKEERRRQREERKEKRNEHRENSGNERQND